MDILVVFPQIHYIEVFDITNKFPQSPGTSLNRGSTVFASTKDAALQPYKKSFQYICKKKFTTVVQSNLY